MNKKRHQKWMFKELYGSHSILSKRSITMKRIDITSFKGLGNDLTQVKHTLHQYAEANAELSCNGIIVDAAILSMFCEYLIDLDRKKMKKCQREGIEKALQRKSEGTGCYGRPQITLPNDFEKQIRKHFQNKMTLAEYQKKTKIKKSTFYKYAKRIRKTMLNEELNDTLRTSSDDQHTQTRKTKDT